MTEIIKLGCSLEGFEKIKGLILQGYLIGLPTETVYGLAADATNNQAVASIFALKNRPSFNPLICHFAHVNHILDHCFPHPILNTLAEHFWPGPLTVILKRHPNSPISPLVSAGLDTLAVRIPDHPIALEVIERTMVPLAAPSANPSEYISPTSAEHVLKGFGEQPQLPFILDGGPCKIGLESTVLDLSQTQPMVLRPGGISIEQLREIMDDLQEFKMSPQAPIRGPGLSKRHYAPSIPLRLNAQSVSKTEVLLSFGSSTLKGAKMTLNLSETGDLLEAAENLFRMMHEADQPALYTAIAVMPIPNEGIGVAINDRLQRAST